jgi:hypothetical protein
MRRFAAIARSSAAGLALLTGATSTAAAHAGSIEAATSTPPIPTWFIVLTAGVVVGTSFLFTSLMADHETLRLVNGLGLRGGFPGTLTSGLRVFARVVSLSILVGVVVVGLLGPTDPQASAAAMVIWVGWWGGYTMTSYLGGNSWPLLDPFRLLTTPFRGRSAPITYPAELGIWPAVVGLLGIVWLEVATGVSANPRLLAVVVLVYTAATLIGVATIGRPRWFEAVDPISWIFRTYGRLAPLQRTDQGFELRLPGAALTDSEITTTPGVPAFVVALLWATTFDGLVSTPVVQSVAGPLIRAGVPAPLLYGSVLVAGFGLFYDVYRRACRRSRESAETYVTGAAIERWFAPSLVPIAAGYHLAHFLGYVISLAPALASTIRSPLAGQSSIPILVLPEWFGLVQLAFVLLGHLLAIWVAHSIAFEVFPGVRQPIRSQYPMILVMIGYTMVSAWVIVSPSTAVILS